MPELFRLIGEGRKEAEALKEAGSTKQSAGWIESGEGWFDPVSGRVVMGGKQIFPEGGTDLSFAEGRGREALL